MNTGRMPGYGVKHEILDIGSFSFVIRSLRNNRQFADHDGAAEAAGISSAAWPMFGLVWPSARILADAMQTEDIAGKRILEVGCGLALASMVIHRRKGDVTASDRHPLAPGFLERNLILNAMPRLPYLTGNWDQDNPALGRFDLIIASDVLYERNQPEALCQFINRHASESADVIVVDPDRGHRNSFCRRMAAQGYVPSIRRAARTQSTGEPYKGHFLNFSRRGGQMYVADPTP